MYYNGVHVYSALVFVAILCVVLITYKKSKHFDNVDEKINGPIRILKKRYAKGEISKEEFEQMKNDIKN
jgi:putative membrane protein